MSTCIECGKPDPGFACPGCKRPMCGSCGHPPSPHPECDFLCYECSGKAVHDAQVAGSPPFKLWLARHIPEELQPGILYVSLPFGTATHLCPCGCESVVVTPLAGERAWQIDIEGDLATLSPSIGNFQIPCRSHYWIRDNEVHWA